MARVVADYGWVMTRSTDDVRDEFNVTEVLVEELKKVNCLTRLHILTSLR